MKTINNESLLRLLLRPQRNEYSNYVIRENVIKQQRESLEDANVSVLPFIESQYNIQHNIASSKAKLLRISTMHRPGTCSKYFLKRTVQSPAFPFNQGVSIQQQRRVYHHSSDSQPAGKQTANESMVLQKEQQGDIIWAALSRVYPATELMSLATVQQSSQKHESNTSHRTVFFRNMREPTISVVDHMDRRNSSREWLQAAQLLIRFAFAFTHSFDPRRSSITDLRSQGDVEKLSDVTLIEGLTSEHVAYILNRVQFPAEIVGFEVGLLAFRIGAVLKSMEIHQNSQRDDNSVSPLASFIKLLHPNAVARVLKLSVQRSQEALEEQRIQNASSNRVRGSLDIRGVAFWDPKGRLLSCTTAESANSNRDTTPSSESTTSLNHLTFDSLQAIATAASEALAILPPLWLLAQSSPIGTNAMSEPLLTPGSGLAVLPVTFSLKRIVDQKNVQRPNNSAPTSTNPPLSVATPTWLELICVYLTYRQTQLASIEGLQRVAKTLETNSSTVEPLLHPCTAFPDSGAPIPLAKVLSDVASSCAGRIEIPATLSVLFDRRLQRSLSKISSQANHSHGVGNSTSKLSPRSLVTDVGIASAESSMRASLLLHCIHSLQLKESESGSTIAATKSSSTDGASNSGSVSQTNSFIQGNVAFLPFASFDIKAAVSLSLSVEEREGLDSTKPVLNSIIGFEGSGDYVTGPASHRTPPSTIGETSAGSSMVPISLLLSTTPLHELLVSLSIHQLKHREIPTPAIAGSVMSVLRFGGGVRMAAEKTPSKLLPLLLNSSPALPGGHWAETMKVAEIIRRLHGHHTQQRKTVTSVDESRIQMIGTQQDYGESYLLAIAACLEKVVVEVSAIKTSNGASQTNERRMDVARAIMKNIDDWMLQYVCKSNQLQTSTSPNHINGHLTPIKDAIASAEKRLNFSATLIEVVYMLHWCRSALAKPDAAQSSQLAVSGLPSLYDEIYDGFLLGGQANLRTEVPRVLSRSQEKNCNLIVRLLCTRPESAKKFKTATISEEVENAIQRLIRSMPSETLVESNFFEGQDEPNDDKAERLNSEVATSTQSQQDQLVVESYMRVCLKDTPSHVLQKTLHPARILSLADNMNDDVKGRGPNPFSLTTVSPSINLSGNNGLVPFLTHAFPTDKKAINDPIMKQDGFDTRIVLSGLLQAAEVQRVLRASLGIDFDQQLADQRTDKDRGYSARSPPRLGDALHISCRLLESLAYRQFVNLRDHVSEQERPQINRYSSQGGNHKRSHSAFYQSTDTLEMVLRHCSYRQLPIVVKKVIGCIGEGSELARFVSSTATLSAKKSNLLETELCQIALRRLDFLLPTNRKRSVLHSISAGSEDSSNSYMEVKELKVAMALEIVEACFGIKDDSKAPSSTTSSSSLHNGNLWATVPSPIASYLLRNGLQLPSAADMLSLLSSAIAVKPSNTEDSQDGKPLSSSPSLQGSISNSHLNNITDEWLVDLAIRDLMVTTTRDYQNSIESKIDREPGAVGEGPVTPTTNGFAVIDLGVRIEAKYKELLSPLKRTGRESEPLTLEVVAAVHKECSNVTMLLLAIANRCVGTTPTNPTPNGLAIAAELINSTLKGHLALTREVEAACNRQLNGNTNAFSVIVAPIYLGCHNFSSTTVSQSDDHFRPHSKTSDPNYIVLSTTSVPAELLPLVDEELLKKCLRAATTQITAREQKSDANSELRSSNGNSGRVRGSGFQREEQRSRLVRVVFPSPITTTTLTGYFTRVKALVDHSWQLVQRKRFLHRIGLSEEDTYCGTGNNKGQLEAEREAFEQPTKLLQRSPDRRSAPSPRSRPNGDQDRATSGKPAMPTDTLSELHDALINTTAETVCLRYWYGGHGATSNSGGVQAVGSLQVYEVTMRVTDAVLNVMLECNATNRHSTRVTAAGLSPTNDTYASYNNRPLLLFLRLLRSIQSVVPTLAGAAHHHVQQKLLKIGINWAEVPNENNSLSLPAAESQFLGMKNSWEVVDKIFEATKTVSEALLGLASPAAPPFDPQFINQFQCICYEIGVKASSQLIFSFPPEITDEQVTAEEHTDLSKSYVLAAKWLDAHPALKILRGLRGASPVVAASQPCLNIMLPSGGIPRMLSADAQQLADLIDGDHYNNRHLMALATTISDHQRARLQTIGHQVGTDLHSNQVKHVAGVLGWVRDLRSHLALFDDAVQTVHITAQSGHRPAEPVSYVEKIPKILPFWMSDVGKGAKGSVPVWGTTRNRMVEEQTHVRGHVRNSSEVLSLVNPSLSQTSSQVNAYKHTRTFLAIVRRALGLTLAVAVVDSFEDGLREAPPSPGYPSKDAGRNPLSTPSALTAVAKFCAHSFSDELYASGTRLLVQHKTSSQGHLQLKHYDLAHLFLLCSNAHNRERSGDLSDDPRIKSMLVDQVKILEDNARYPASYENSLLKPIITSDVKINEQQKPETKQTVKQSRFSDDVTIVAFRKAMGLPLPKSQVGATAVFNDEIDGAIKAYGSTAFTAEVLSALFPCATPKTAKLLEGVRAMVEHSEVASRGSSDTLPIFDNKLSTLIYSEDIDFDEGLFGRNALFLSPPTRVKVIPSKGARSSPLAEFLNGPHQYTVPRSHWKAVVAVLVPLLCEPIPLKDQPPVEDFEEDTDVPADTSKPTMLSSHLRNASYQEAAGRLSMKNTTSGTYDESIVKVKAEKAKLEAEVASVLETLKRKFRPISFARSRSEQQIQQLSSKTVSQFFLHFPHAWPIGVFLFSSRYPEWTKAGLGNIVSSEPDALEALWELTSDDEN